MKEHLKEKVGALFILLFIVLQGVFFSIYVSKVTAGHKWVAHTFQVIIGLKRLEVSIYKQPLAINDVKSDISNIKELTKDNLSQIEHVQKLEQDLSAPNFNRDLMLAQISDMKKEEFRLLDLRINQSEAATNTFLLFLGISFFISNAALFTLMILLSLSRNKIKEREDMLDRAVRSTSDALWDWDPNTNWVYYSPRFTELLGYAEKDFTPTLAEFNSRLHPDDAKRVWEALQDHYLNHIPYNIEYRLLHKNGEYKWFQARGQAIWDKKGRAIRMSGFISDINEKKEIQRIKDEFISTVSHELRTPLTSIRGSIGLLLAETEGPLTKDMRHFLEIAYSNSERLIILINDILDIDKIESNKMRFNITKVNIADFINKAIELNKAYSEKYHVNFVINEPLLQVDVLADGDRLMQVMTNLLSNAAKFSPANNSVEIGTVKNNNMLCVYVKDYGSGIPLELQSSLFTKFYQVNDSKQKQKEGTGLGLYICKQLLEKMGGKIYLESIPKKGTTFYFQLPMMHKGIKNIKAAENAEKKREKLLICEDDYKVAEYLKKVVQKVGFDADVSTTITQAKEFLRTNSYAGIILDVILPDQNGVEFIFELRSNPKFENTPIIIVSIKSIEEEKIYGGSLGLIDWLTKPVDPNKLLEAINKIPRTKTIPQILYVEDDEGMVSVIGRNLHNIANVIPATTIAQAKDILSNKDIDLIILDIVLPDGNGLEIINCLDDEHPVPVVVLSANESPDYVNEKVSASFIKSYTSEATIINTIKQMIQHSDGR